MTKTAWAIGVDLGGTKLDVGVVDLASGKVLDRILIKTKAKEGADPVIQDIITAVQELRSRHTNAIILAIGVGIAGQIEANTGIVRFAPNLNWHDIPLKTELNKATQLPVYITNDVRAAAWGEWLYGAGKGCDDILCLFVGTGIGSGIVSGGRMLVGSTNSAGEVGHMTIDVNGPQCTCGSHGCFEALAAGWAIARRAKEAVQRDAKGGQALLEMVQGNASELTAKHVFQLSRSGDALANSIVNEVTIDLIAGISGLVNAFNPQRVILGGGIIQGYPEFIDKIREGVSNTSLSVAAEHLQIVQAELHGDAGVVGAAAFASNTQLVGEKR